MDKYLVKTVHYYVVYADSEHEAAEIVDKIYENECSDMDYDTIEVIKLHTKEAEAEENSYCICDNCDYAYDNNYNYEEEEN